MKLVREQCYQGEYRCAKCGSEDFIKENTTYYCKKCFWHVHNKKQKKLIDKNAKVKIIVTHNVYAN